MTTFTNSEGLVITHTNGLLTSMLLQLNSSNTYYTSGEHAIIYMCIYIYIYLKIGSNKVLLSYYT